MKTYLIILCLAAFVNPKSFLVKTEDEIEDENEIETELGQDYEAEDDDGLTHAERLKKMLNGDGEYGQDYGDYDEDYGYEKWARLDKMHKVNSKKTPQEKDSNSKKALSTKAPKHHKH